MADNKSLQKASPMNSNNNGIGGSSNNVVEHITKIISQNAAIVETLDPLWSKKFMSSRNNSSSNNNHHVMSSAGAPSTSSRHHSTSSLPPSFRPQLQHHLHQQQQLQQLQHHQQQQQQQQQQLQQQQQQQMFCNSQSSVVVPTALVVTPPLSKASSLDMTNNYYIRRRYSDVSFLDRNRNLGASKLQSALLGHAVTSPPPPPIPAAAGSPQSQQQSPLTTTTTSSIPGVAVASGANAFGGGGGVPLAVVSQPSKTIMNSNCSTSSSAQGGSLISSEQQQVCNGHESVIKSGRQVVVDQQQQQQQLHQQQNIISGQQLLVQQQELLQYGQEGPSLVNLLTSKVPLMRASPTNTGKAPAAYGDLHPENPERSVIKDLLLKARDRETSTVTTSSSSASTASEQQQQQQQRKRTSPGPQTSPTTIGIPPSQESPVPHAAAAAAGGGAAAAANSSGAGVQPISLTLASSPSAAHQEELSMLYYVCTICKIAFRNKENLEAHQLHYCKGSAARGLLPSHHHHSHHGADRPSLFAGLGASGAGGGEGTAAAMHQQHLHRGSGSNHHQSLMAEHVQRKVSVMENLNSSVLHRRLTQGPPASPPQGAEELPQVPPAPAGGPSAPAAQVAKQAMNAPISLGTILKKTLESPKKRKFSEPVFPSNRFVVAQQQQQQQQSSSFLPSSDLHGHHGGLPILHARKISVVQQPIHSKLQYKYSGATQATTMMAHCNSMSTTTNSCSSSSLSSSTLTSVAKPVPASSFTLSSPVAVVSPNDSSMVTRTLSTTMSLSITCATTSSSSLSASASSTGFGLPAMIEPVISAYSPSPLSAVVGGEVKMDILAEYMPHLALPKTKITLNGPLIFPVLKRILVENTDNVEFQAMEPSRGASAFDSLLGDKVPLLQVASMPQLVDEGLDVDMTDDDATTSCAANISSSTSTTANSNDSSDNDTALNNSPVRTISTTPATVAEVISEDGNSTSSKPEDENQESVPMSEEEEDTKENQEQAVPMDDQITTSTITALATRRPSTLQLQSKRKLSAFALIGSNLVSPDTPRPKKPFSQLYLNGHAYTYIGLKLSTRSTFCCIYRPQPMFVTQETQPKLSMYSNWQTNPVQEEILKEGLLPAQLMRAYGSDLLTRAFQYDKGLYVQAENSGVVPKKEERKDDMITTHSSYWITRQAEKALLEKKRKQQQLSLSVLVRKTSGCDIDSDDCMRKISEDRGSNASFESDDPNHPKRVRIFEGGFKSNEDYTYVRGRGRGKYVCEECGIRCKKPSMLKKHIRTHTDLRPYSCRHCAFAFKTKGNLTKHMKSKAHHKKCVEMGIVPVPTAIDDSQIDSDALAKQEALERSCNGGNLMSDDDENDDDDEEDEDYSDDEGVPIPLINAAAVAAPSQLQLLGQLPVVAGVAGAAVAAVAAEQAVAKLKDCGNGEELDIDETRPKRSSTTTAACAATGANSNQNDEQEVAQSLLYLSGSWSETASATAAAAAAAAANKSTTSESDLLSDEPPVKRKVSILESQLKPGSSTWSPQNYIYASRPRSFSFNDIPLRTASLHFRPGAGIAAAATGTLLPPLPPPLPPPPPPPPPPPSSEPRGVVALSSPLVRNSIGATCNAEPITNSNNSNSVAANQFKERGSEGRGALSSSQQHHHQLSQHILREDVIMSKSNINSHSSHNKVSGDGALELMVTEEDEEGDSEGEADADYFTRRYSMSVIQGKMTSSQWHSTSSATLALPHKDSLSSSSMVTKRLADAEQPMDLSKSRSSSQLNLEDEDEGDVDMLGVPDQELGPDEPKMTRGQDFMPVGLPLDQEGLDEMTNGKSTCTYCSKTFSKPSQLRLHMNIHYFERPFRCEACAVSFRLHGHLQKHKRSVSHFNKVNMNMTFGTPTTDNPRPFKCADCTIAFRIHGHLAKHLRSKMHIMRLECLHKLPFGMYAEMERSGVNLNEIDTTDCENSLISLQALSRRMHAKNPVCAPDPSMSWVAGGGGENNNNLSEDCDEDEMEDVEGGCGLVEESPKRLKTEERVSITKTTRPSLVFEAADDEQQQERRVSFSLPLHIERTSVTLNDESAVAPSNRNDRLPSELGAPITTPNKQPNVIVMPSSMHQSQQQQQQLTTFLSPAAPASNFASTRSNTCHLCDKVFKSAKFLQVHLYCDHQQQRSTSPYCC